MENQHVQFSGNTIPVEILSVKTKALLDTGAQSCFISNQFLKSLNLSKSSIKSTNLQCTLADRSTVSSHGKVHLPVYIKGTRYNVEFNVLDQLNHPVIIGFNFLQRYGAILRISEHSTQVTLSAIPVYAKHDIQIPALSEIICPGVLHFNTNLADGETGECSLFSHLTNKSLLVPTSACRVIDHTVPIRILNASRHASSIACGERLATFRHVPEDHYQPQPQSSPTDSSEITPGSIPAEPLSNVQHSSSRPAHLEFDFSQSVATPEEIAKLQDLVDEFADVFVDPKTGLLGKTNLVSHKIKLQPGAKPVQKFPYRQSPQMRQEMNKIIQEQIRQGIIEESKDSPWSSPALLVAKKAHGKGQDKSYRLVIDYRALNACTIPLCLRLPRLDEVMDEIGQSHPKYFTTLDLQSGFHQMDLHKDSRDKTGFLTHTSKYVYKRLPMGLRNSPVYFQSLMDSLFAGQKFTQMMIYMDDLICFSETIEQHISHLRDIFIRLREAGLKLKTSKCCFARSQVAFLGHVLSPAGISPDPEKISAFTTYPVPKTVTQIRRFVGAVGFYRRFIQDFSLIARPLHDLTRKNAQFVWTPACQKAFDTLKTAITSDDVLKYPDFSQEFVLATDASTEAIGATLCQYDDNKVLRPVSYAGRSLTKSEKNYSATQLEILGAVWAVQYYQVYLQGVHFELWTDHAALKWLLDRKEASPRLARFALLIQGFDFTVKHIQGKLNVLPDCLSRREYPYDRTKEDDVLDAFPDLSSISLHSKSTQTVPQSDFETPVSESSQTPWYANTFSSDSHCLVDAINHQVSLSETPKSRNVHFSQPLSITIHYEADTSILPETASVPTTTTDPESGSVHSKPDSSVASPVPATELAPVDARNDPLDLPAPLLSKARRRRRKLFDAVLDTADKPLQMLDLTPAAIQIKQEQDPFCSPLIGYLQDGRLPADPTEARSIILRESDYVYINHLLYHVYTSSGTKASTTTAQLVIPKALQAHILSLHHSSSFSGHLASRKMIHILKNRFFWPGMLTAIVHHVASCATCHTTKKMTHPIKPPLTLRDQSPHAYHTVCIDWIGPLVKSDDSNLYLFCCVDFYSRHCTLFATNSVSAQCVSRQFHDKVICQFGAPSFIVSDRGSAFISGLFSELCKCYNITQHLASAYHPQSSGLVERYNRSILSILRAYVSSRQTDWDVFLPSVQFALNTSAAYSTSYTPYYMLYGRQVTLPTEMHLSDPFEHSLTVKQQLVKMLQGHSIASEVAAQHMRTVHAAMKQRYDATARPLKLEPGDIVYLNVPRLRVKSTKMKLNPPNRGPYIILHFTSPTTVQLRRLSDCKVLPDSVNVARLKPAELRTQDDTPPPADQATQDGNDDTGDDTSPDVAGDVDPRNIPPDLAQAPPALVTSDEQQATSRPGVHPKQGEARTSASGDALPGSVLARDSTSSQAQLVPRDHGSRPQPLINPVAPGPVLPTGPQAHRPMASDAPLPQPTGPAATKNTGSSSYHAIQEILQCSQTPDTGLRIHIHFTDDSYRWVPLSALNAAARELFFSLRLPIQKVPRLRSRK